VNCTGGWFTLPSGNMICYITTLLPASNRSDYCQNLGGSLLEIYTREDFTMLVHIVKRLIAANQTTKTALIALGADVLVDGNSSILIWKGSRTLVDYSRYGIIRPFKGNLQVARPTDVLYLKSDNYNVTGFSFGIYGYLQSDTSSTFLCMKAGTVQTSLAKSTLYFNFNTCIIIN
jgi:hypothetical protein